jgi:hypothetical protein
MQVLRPNTAADLKAIAQTPPSHPVFDLIFSFVAGAAKASDVGDLRCRKGK